jgi:C4-dicarboxylate-specific signal transduction histidine kinase
MGEVATGMAHELNQPLSAIVNYANGCGRRLQSGLGNKKQLLAAMQQITAQAERASEIIRRLRALVAKQPPLRARVDLNHLIREVCSFVEYDSSKLQVSIELDLPPRPIAVNVDLVQIEQVLLNLVRNALDALQEVPVDRRRLCVSSTSEEGRARVKVSDSGNGIGPERLGRLFDPFFTTKPTGMGMGLPISQTIVHDHAGHIWVHSEPGIGTDFYIELPLIEAVPQAAQVAGMR